MPPRGPPMDAVRRPGAALAAALCSAATEQARYKGDTAPRRGLQSKLASAADDDGGSTERSSLPAALRRFEQRMEAERRHVDRQIERLERRIEEVAAANSAGGCWAELQGYVDGLSETVQGLVRQSEGGTAGGSLSGSFKSTCDANGTARPSSAQSEALSLRVAAMERRMSQLEGPGGQLIALQGLANEASEQSAELNSKILQLGTRLMQAERGIDSLGGLSQEVFALRESRFADSEACGGKNSAGPLGVEMQQVLQGLCEEVESIAPRLMAVEEAIEAGHPAGEFGRLQQEATKRRDLQVGDDVGSVSAVERSQDADELREQLREACDQIDVLRSDLEDLGVLTQDQVSQLAARFQDLESEVQDVANAHEARQEVEHVGERALRLALRAQRAAQSQGFSDDTRDLREELGSMGEDLATLWGRVEGAECGLESMAEALGRICEELGHLRGGSTRRLGETDAPRKSSGGAAKAVVCQPFKAGQGPSMQGAGRQTAEEDVSPASSSWLNGKDSSELHKADLPSQDLTEEEESKALRSKVQELERSLESMAEVVWDLRKQVSSLRSRSAGASTGAAEEKRSDGDISEA
eukprot:gb/GFBE01016986.1/.p1 GENE.gb/GFBE01016986.1/~~gb/GFBE01016986.1/.p1  ORF type:complete len:585 (+),score=134.60 gb/GFBE01016986.1/:1-1755(+)